MNMILAHKNGLLVGCKVLERDGDRVRVKVNGEKRPKWVDTSVGKQDLFDDCEQAMAWQDAVSPQD